MKNHSLRILLLAVLLIAPARGQDPDDDPEDTEPRDPFALPDRKRADPAGVPAALPTLTLRGFIETADGKRIALLEIDSGRTYLVRKGDSLTHSGTTLRIADLDKQALHIEVGQSGRIVVVR